MIPSLPCWLELSERVINSGVGASFSPLSDGILLCLLSLPVRQIKSETSWKITAKETPPLGKDGRNRVQNDVQRTYHLVNLLLVRLMTKTL